MKDESMKPLTTQNSSRQGRPWRRSSFSLSDAGSSSLAEAEGTSLWYIQEAECHNCRVSGHSSISYAAPDWPCDEVEVRRCLQGRCLKTLRGRGQDRQEFAEGDVIGW